jgi:hypothetical protein
MTILVGLGLWLAGSCALAWLVGHFIRVGTRD